VDRAVEGRGLIARVRGERDGRVQHITQTPAATTPVRRSTPRLLQGEQAAPTGMSTAEHAMLVELLHKRALERRRVGVP
jgi:DNA-binding MarR family transcriptional regulator